MPGSEVRQGQSGEDRRRWAAELASRVFSEMEEGTDFVLLAKEIEDYAAEGKVPETKK